MGPLLRCFARFGGAGALVFGRSSPIFGGAGGDFRPFLPISAVQHGVFAVFLDHFGG